MINEEHVDICLTREPLDVAAAVVRVTCAEAGGIAVFLGTTRAEPAGKPGGEGRGALVSLDYHAYEEMAISQLRKLAARAFERWPVARAAIWHRIGDVRVGESSVVIAVSCPHRGEAFDACEFLIDELKKIVPIWKREVYESTSRWQ
ncbi:MAG TPA: molybdenum cofactor biosynthesis protein MoaE [Phycisphaerae bacterium]|nr:molybdenum cofactor biosynthesis protein MoaE [Phycisphaerae bacterium]